MSSWMGASHGDAQLDHPQDILKKSSGGKCQKNFSKFLRNHVFAPWDNDDNYSPTQIPTQFQPDWMEICLSIAHNEMKKCPEFNTTLTSCFISLRPLTCERKHKHFVENIIICNRSYSRLHKMHRFPSKWGKQCYLKAI